MKYCTFFIVCHLLFQVNLVTAAGVAHDDAMNVSLTSLLSVPEKFDSKKVRVKGFGLFGFEDSYICLNRESVEFGILNNCLSAGATEVRSKIDPNDVIEKLNNRYIVIEGVFREPKPRGANPNKARLLLGTIDKVNYIDKLHVMAPMVEKSVEP